ncbi:MAG: hypothetical protein Q9M91_05350 [Candidatus Dojkabacteria bacterium]|nr:hypothetical protein [Candidatus Dojkabacteria bacterium]MDQ7021229.1 hypothetical protein [Candidatus Dojkabacteria bacterium]
MDSYLLLKKELDFQDIRISKSPSNRNIVPNFEKQIQSLWEEDLKKAKSEGYKRWDSILYRLNSFSVNNDELYFDLGEVNFSTAVGLKSINKIKPLNINSFSKALFINSLVITTDNKYVFGVRNNTKIRDMIGGVISKSEMEVNNGKDLERFLLVELKEECNIDIFHIKSVKFLGLIQSRSTRISISCKTNLNISSFELENIFKSRLDNELEALDFVEYCDLEGYLGNFDGYQKIMKNFI